MQYRYGLLTFYSLFKMHVASWKEYICVGLHARKSGSHNFLLPGQTWVISIKLPFKQTILLLLNKQFSEMVFYLFFKHAHPGKNFF